MRIATWNLESAKSLSPAREAAIHRAMDEVEADAWVLTETWIDFSPGQGFCLAAHSIGASDFEPTTSQCWVAIWSRYDAASLEIRGQAARLACAAIKNSDGRKSLVAGTVLPWRSDRLWPGDQGFREAIQQQATEWQRLRATSASATFVVAGDFNQSLPYRPHYGSKQNHSELEQALLANDLMLLTTGDDPLTNLPRIDHICIHRSDLGNVRPSQAQTWRVPLSSGNCPASDHSGAFIDIVDMV